MSIVLKVLKRFRRYGNRVKWGVVNGRLPRAKDGSRLLHLGCGTIDAEGFVNIDARALPHVHFVVKELAEVKFIPPGSFDLVYMSHVLEHVPHQAVVSVLEVVHGILRPGGVCRVAVPDFDALVRIYEADGRSLERIIFPLFGGQDYPYNFHYAVFNEAWLTGLFRMAGFSEVRWWDPDTCDHHAFTDASSLKVTVAGKAYPISLNLEAMK